MVLYLTVYTGETQQIPETTMVTGKFCGFLTFYNVQDFFYHLYIYYLECD